MSKNIKVTKEQLQRIIKEGVQKLHKETLIKNRIKQINEELAALKTINEFGGPMHKKHDDLEILKHYLEAAVWADGDEEWSNEMGADDVDKASVVKSLEDIKAFMAKAGNLVGDMPDSQIGHDLWLSRQGHGTGFWDRGLGDRGDVLGDMAREMGEKYLYLGDDQKVHIE